MAGIVPGLLAIGCLLVMNRIISGRRGYGGQAENYTKEEKRHIIIDAIPSLMMPLLVLGGVLLGIMTPTESAVIAVVYAFILAFFVYRELKLKDLLNLFTSAAVTTSVIMLIIGCAAPFGWLLAINNVPNIITEAILGLSTNPVVIMALITVLLLFLGTFMDLHYCPADTDAAAGCHKTRFQSGSFRRHPDTQSGYRRHYPAPGGLSVHCLPDSGHPD